MPDIRYTTVGAVCSRLHHSRPAVARAARSVIHRLAQRPSTSPAPRTARWSTPRARQLTRALTLAGLRRRRARERLAGAGALRRQRAAVEPAAARHWALTHGVNLVIIFVAAFIVIRAANLAIDHFQFKLARRHATRRSRMAAARGDAGRHPDQHGDGDGRLRRDLMLLRELEIDILPILTGAGIAGLAIGFGAQNLVRDVISGFFLILEDQVRIGDLARINGVAGTVEQINLRTIVVRDGEGAVQVFPTARSRRWQNLSKQFALCGGRRADRLQREHGSGDRHDARGRRVDGARIRSGVRCFSPRSRCSASSR